MRGSGAGTFASVSLYVGDLEPDVSETTLFELFNTVGAVASIKVCRDQLTRKSLGYGYVNYHTVADAERALEHLNYTAIHGRPCRLMWSQRDPNHRKTGSANLFVKNLDKTIDCRSLHDTFSLFGPILSCKVATDAQGRSKGFGFVQFETQEAADVAMTKVNGMKIASKDVVVVPFVPKSNRSTPGAVNFTNVYCRGFPASWDEEKVKATFAPFGEITSVYRSADAKSGAPYACVNFAEHESAVKAIEALNGSAVEAATEADDKAVDTEATLYVARAMDKSERVPKAKAHAGVNLYIKNLEESVDDEKLRTMFEPFGNIISCKVMRDEEGKSRKFGFVSFSNPDEASKAIAQMHLSMIGTQPLYVGLAEQKDRRHARLANHFESQRAPKGVPAMAPMPMGANGVPVQPSQMPPLPGVAPYSYPYAAQGAWGYPTPVWKANSYQSVAQPVAPVNAKQMYGEQLFPLVSKIEPDLAGKITGMILDMDEAELVQLIRSEQLLREKVSEAKQVLKNHA